jgi:hypothetical protein
MRRVLVDSARSRRYQKRGGGVMKVSLDEGHAIATDRSQDLVALDEALTALTTVDEQGARDRDALLRRPHRRGDRRRPGRVARYRAGRLAPRQGLADARAP